MSSVPARKQPAGNDVVAVIGTACAGGFYGAVAALKGVFCGDGFESGDTSGWSP
jgi:hypothetical protein